MINEIDNFWLGAGWVDCYLQRSLWAQVNGGPDANTDRGKQLISAVRVSGRFPVNGIYWWVILASAAISGRACSVVLLYTVGYLENLWNRLPKAWPLTHWGLDKMAVTLADDTFKSKLVNENILIAIKNSLKFVPKGPINNMPALV